MTVAQPAGRRRSLLAVVLLAAGAVAWAAVPMRGADPGARPALIAATCCAAASVLRIAVPLALPRLVTRLRPADDYYSPVRQRAWLLVSFAFASTPWAQAMTVAVLALEALHRAGPWHVAVLGVVLLGYLLALHLVESAAGLAALRPHVPLVIAGLALAGLSAGAAVLPTVRAGSGWLSVLAAIAAVVAAALALPI